jgi:DNA-binding GntR family transcriptional regulator
MSATDEAYAFAKKRILDGRFAGGELISEGDVAAGVGLSRTPVREAFLRLEGEGLLRLYPKRGALVVPVSAAEMRHVMETRLLVERYAIERSLPAPPARPHVPDRIRRASRPSMASPRRGVKDAI